MEKSKTLGGLKQFRDFQPVMKTFATIVDEAATANPSGEAFIFGNNRLTFLQFQEQVNRIAKGLIGIGVQRGDHVALLMHNIVEFPLAAMAVAKAGGIVVTCNTRFKQDELSYVLNKAKVSTLITIDVFEEAGINYLDMINSLVPELSTSARGSLSSAEMPFLKKVVVLRQGVSDSYYSLDDLELAGREISDDQLRNVQSGPQPDDAGMIIFTSGTTGFPKGVVLKYSPLITSSATIKVLWEIDRSDKVLSYIPYFTVYGVITALVGPFTNGTPVVVGNVFDPGEFLRFIEDEKVSILATVPAMIEALFQHPNFPSTDFSSLRTGNIGGSLCPPEMMRRVRSPEKGWGMDCPGMMTVYGLTETHSGITAFTLNDPEEQSLHTVGRAYPLNELKAVDTLTGEEKAPGEEGEIIVRGHALMAGYFEDTQQTGERIKNGWLHTGDLGFIDEGGYLTITGRATDMIITGGFNVFPKEIENKILEHPRVISSSVVGVPDRKYGEVPMAYIILEAGESVATDEIIAFCKGKMASYKVPRYVAFVKAFPMNAGGKVQKFKQKEMAIAELGLDPDS